MNETIAVYAGPHGLCAFDEATELSVMQKNPDGWATALRLPLPEAVAEASMQAVRDRARAAAALLGNCRVLAGKKLGGLSFGVFDRLGFHLFEIGEVSNAVLDGILSDIVQGDERARLLREIVRQARPVETADPGVYFLDLVRLQKECPGISSKRALTEFLQSTPFLALHLVCAHLPPWLESSGFDIRTLTLPDKTLRCVVTRRQRS